MQRPVYDGLWHRLTANIHEPRNEQDCWLWARKLDREAYGHFNLYVPGLRKLVTPKAHIATWLLCELGAMSADDLWLAYQEHSCSGMELDHLCSARCCIYPDHLELVTGSINSIRRDRRMGLRS